MNFGIRLEIDFHQPEEASVFLETNASEEDRRFAEILIFCCLAVRQMCNLNTGGDPGGSARSLAALLTQVPDNLSLIVSAQLPDTARLVEYRGSPGRRRFIATLDFENGGFRFTLDAKGFGFLGRGLGYYGPNSILILLRYLAQRRASERDYWYGLAQAAAECGAAFLQGAISITTQNQIAFSAASAAADLLSQDETLPERRDAESGDARAQFALGVRYDQGWGIPQDYSEAAKWYQKAAEQGLPSAQFNLASLYREGSGVPLDYAEAIRWYSKAAEQQHALAMTNLGLMYLNGLGVC